MKDSLSLANIVYVHVALFKGIPPSEIIKKIKESDFQHPRLAAYLRKYAIKIVKKAIKMKCVRTEKQF